MNEISEEVTKQIEENFAAYYKAKRRHTSQESSEERWERTFAKIDDMIKIGEEAAKRRKEEWGF